MNSQEIITPELSPVEEPALEIPESRPEFIPSDEKTPASEQAPHPEAPRHPTETGTRRPGRSIPAPATAPDPMSQEVEKILEEGLRDTYTTLSPIAKEEFKLQGEKTTAKIRLMLNSTRVKAAAILRLILLWLRLLPGINQYFLLKEAKIKTDKILNLKKDSNL